MTDLPGNVQTCGVKGHFAFARLSPGDADGVLDLVPVVGLVVTLTPSPTHLKDVTATPPTVIVPEPLVLTTDSNGDLRDVDGNSTAYVIASDDPDLNPHDWTYTVSFAGTSASKFAAYSAAFPAGETIDLSLITPIPSALGVSVSVAQAAEAAAAAYAASAAASAEAAATLLVPDETVPQLMSTSVSGYLVPGVDPNTKRFPAAVEEALATNVVAPASASAVSALAAPRTATYLPPPNAFGADDTAVIQAAVNSVPSGGSLVVGDRYRVDGQLNIASPMTLSLTARGEIYSSAGTAAQTMVNVTSSGVRIDGPGKITGPQFAAAANQNLIKFTGASGSAPLTDVSVRGVTLSGSGKYGILASYVKGFAFDRNVVKDVCYGGIAVICAINGSVDGNLVQNITQTGYTNSYGIYTTRNEVDVTVDEPRCENISICGNRIIDIPNWDGINTHAGKTHTISNNVIINVGKPIEMVACQGTGGAEKYAPLDMTVTGNTITSTVTNGSRGAAITLVGADGVGIGGGVGNPAEYATGTISGNTIRGHGTDGSGTSGAIIAYYTKGAIITANTIAEPSPTGILLYHTNAGFTCTDNTIIDPWATSSSIAVAVSVQSQYNVGHLDGNSVQLNGKTATHLADRGLSIANQTGNSVTIGTNALSAATTPISDTGAKGKLMTDRANQSGTQAISTVTGLQAALDAAVAAGTPGAWVPADNGLLACDVDPLLCGSTLTLASAGVVYLRKMKMAVASVITNVNLVVSGAGAGLSNAYVAVFNSAGTQLGVSADVSTTLQSTGAKVIPLSSPTASQSAGAWVYVAILVGGATTLPTVRAYATTGHNFGMTSAYRWGTSGTGQTSMPSSITPAGIASAAGAAPLVGLT